MNDPRNHADSGEFARKVLTATGIVGGLAVLALVIFYTIDVLLLLFAGVLLATFLDGLSAWINTKLRIPRTWSLCVAILGVTGLSALVVWLLLPSVADQIDQLKEQMPAAFENAKVQIEKVFPVERLLRKVPSVQDLVFGKAGMGLFTQIAGFFSGTVSLIANLVVFLFSGLYMAVNPDIYLAGLIRLIPPVRRERAQEIVHFLGRTLRWWLVGTFLDMTAVGILTGIGLWILGIRLALTLAIFTALLTFIPFIGPAIAIIPALLLAFIRGPMTVLYVVVLYIAVQIIEGNLSAPLIQQRAVQLPPVLTLIVQIVFGSFFGFLGLVLATPLAAVALVLVRKVYVEDVLGDRKAE